MNIHGLTIDPMETYRTFFKHKSNIYKNHLLDHKVNLNNFKDMKQYNA